jgi:uncharacterized cysteine cluster protein YcgN (CxxCxxCC family)
MGEWSSSYNTLVGKPKWNRPHGRPRRRWEDETDLKEIVRKNVYCILLTQEKGRCRAREHVNEHPVSIKGGEFHDCLSITTKTTPWSWSLLLFTRLYRTLRPIHYNHYWSIMLHHMSSNNVWFTHHRSLAVTGIHLIANQEMLVNKCAWIFPRVSNTVGIFNMP